MSKRGKLGPLANEALLREQRKQEKHHSARVAKALSEVLATHAGRFLVYDLIIRRCQLVGGIFAGEASHTTAYHEGRRSIGRLLMQAIQVACPERWSEMVAEGTADRAMEERVNQSIQAKAVTEDDGEENTNG